MDASSVKRSLFNQFKDFDEFRGAGVREKNGKEFVVVKLMHADTPLAAMIPARVGNVEVVVETSGEIKAY